MITKRKIKLKRYKQYKSFYSMRCIEWVEAKKEIYMILRNRVKYWQEKPVFNNWKVKLK